MEDLNNVPSSGTYGAAINEVNSNFSLVVNAINSLEYATTKSKGILNYGTNPATAFPNAVEGDWCMILSEGNVFPATIKTYNGTSWTGSGQWNPSGIDLTGYATTAAMNTAIANSLLQATARMGYGEATANNNAYSVTITNYTLPTNGGVVRVKMPTAATGAATLNISSTGAKTILYNGAAVSSQNTWEAQEIISVFYDGTKYMASNSQGGGGKAEKIKYNNLQSGLAAENVQGAVDELSQNVTILDKIRVAEGTSPDLDITDEDGYVLARFEDGQIETKEFASADVYQLKYQSDGSDADLNIADLSGNVIVQFKDGHIATKNFNSRYAGSSNSYAKIRFANWNIAHFNLGSGIVNAIDTEAEYNTYLPVYRKIFNEVNADFLSICEFESPFWKNHSAYTTKRELFPNYKYYKDNATATSNGNWVAFFSHLPLSNVTEVPYNNYPSGKYRYYLVGDMIVSGKNVKVVCTHLTHDTSGTGGSNAYAPLQIAQLISDFQDYQNVVILADWNTAPTGFQPFKDAGYTMANNDFLGTLQTAWSTEWYEGAMDNIVVKGGSINNINVINVNDRGAGTLSDHYLIYCDIVFE